jgi:hypothetical protein
MKYIHRVWDKCRRTEDSNKKVQRPNVSATTTSISSSSSGGSSSSHITTKLIVRSDYVCVFSHRNISVTVTF